MPWLFWLDLVTLGLAALVSTSLIIVVLGTAIRHKANQAFALLVLAQTVWAVASILLRLSLWAERRLPVGVFPLYLNLWLEIAALAIGLMSVMTLNFAAHYLGHYTRAIRVAVIVGLVANALCAIPLFQHRMLSAPQINANGTFVEQISPWGWIGGACALIYITWGWSLLRHKRSRSDPFLRWGLFILILGMLVGGGTRLPFPFTMSTINLIGFALVGYGIIHKQILNPLKRMILEREQAQAQAARRTENLIAVNQLAIRCTATLPEDELYHLIAEELREMTQALSVIVSIFDAEHHQLVVRHVATHGRLLSKANELLGQELIGLKMPVNAAICAQMLEQHVHVEQDLSAISFGAIPPLLAQLVKSAFDIDTLTAVTLQDRGQLIGTLSIVSDSNSPPPDLDVVRTFASVASTALQRARAEAARRESEEWYRTIFDYAADGLMRINTAGIITDVNQRMAEIVGPEIKNLIGQPLTACGYLISRQKLREAIDYFDAEQNRCAPYEMLITRRDGRSVPIEVNARAIISNGQNNGVIVVVRDISERKQTEEALRMRNNELLVLNQAAQAFSSSLELDVVLRAVLEQMRNTLSVAGCSVWLLDTSTGELVCHECVGLKSEIVQGWRLLPSQGIAGWVATHRQSAIIPDTDVDQRHFKGIESETGVDTHSLLAVPLQIQERVIGVLELVDLEIARFTQADLALAEALALTAATAIENARLYEQARHDAQVREALLQEVNHRVRNNLAAILGILKLEMERPRTPDLDYHSTIQDLIVRIRGLASVHNLLSQAQWASLPLERLVYEVISSALSSSPIRRQIQLVLSSPDGTSNLPISPRQATGLAMVLNELTTNSVKYAFQGRPGGRIEVQFSVEQDSWITLTFHDDGPGWPEEVLKKERESVGLRLIRLMVRSPLQGQLELGNDGGAVAKIRFKRLDQDL